MEGRIETYVFDGISMYGTIPDWTPNGLPFSVEVTAIPLKEAAGTVIANTSSPFGPYLSASPATSFDEFRLTLDGVNTDSVRTVGAHASVGEFSEWYLFAGSGRTYISHNSTLGQENTKTASDFKLNQIAVRPSSINFFHGPIWSLKLTDNSPIQDTSACMGNGTRYVTIEQPIVLDGDFEISGDHIRLDGAGAAVGLLGQQNGDFSPHLLIWNSTAGGNENRFSVRGESAGGTSWAGALDDVAQGQHFHWRWVKTGTSHELFIDGVSKGVQTYADTYYFDAIGKVQTNYIPAGSALQNVEIKNLTTGDRWFFPLDEGSGTQVTNTDPSTGAAYNGTWTPDVDWVYIPSNSRFYPMNSKSAGSVIECFEADGVTRVPANDGAIINYDLDNWMTYMPNQQGASSGHQYSVSRGASTHDSFEEVFVQDP